MEIVNNQTAGLPDPMAVSGIGLVTAAGIGVEALWAAFERRESHLGELRQIDTRGLVMTRGGEVDDAMLERDWTGPPADRAARMASVAIAEALRSASLPTGRERVGLSLGTALGPVQTLESIALGKAEGAKWRDVPAHELSGFLGRRHGLEGPTWTFSVTCVSGLYALEQAIADIRLGRADAMLCGGLDTLSLFMQSGFCALRAVSPSGSLRPFDPRHDGIVLGEGAAFVVLEPLSSLGRRGAQPLGIFAGNSLVSDGTHMTSPDGSGRGMAEAIRCALRQSGLEPGAIGCITPTATGSPIYDRMQSEAVLAALGDAGARTPVTTWEPVVGHALASTGVLGIVHSALVLRHDCVLPTFGVEEIDEGCRLHYVLERPEPLQGSAVMALTVGFGGQNGVTVLKRNEDQ